MNDIRVSAKTVDDAITEALIQLGVTSDMIEYEVIEKGSAGFLGIGSRQAVIRAWKKKDTMEQSVEEVVNEAKKEFKKELHDNMDKDGKKAAKKEHKKEAKECKKEKKEEEKEEILKEEKEIPKVEEETIKACETFLKDVLAKMGMEVEIASKVDEDGALSIDMKGENMGILIGKRGQTLDSLQYLTNRVANKTQEKYIRVKLDTENYRKRRKDTLENLARNIAYKVKRTKKAVSLEPMNPYERRIIHSALQGDRYVTTHSEGEEPFRYVVVTPSRR